MDTKGPTIRLVPNRSLDIQIMHEYKKFGETTPVSSGDSKPQPRKNPILQDGDENVEVFRPVCKRIPGCGEATMFTAEDKPRNTKPGDFHPTKTQPKKEKIESIRKIHFSPSKCHEEVQKRQLKTVESTRPAYNPITEGDPASVKEIKVRKFDQEISHHYAKHNEKKYFLPADRKIAPRVLNNEVSPKSNKVIIGQDDTSSVTTETTSISDINQPVHPMVQKHRGTISEVLQYQHAPSFRDQGVSDKVNQVPANVVNVNLNTEKHFARKRIQYE